MRCEWAEPKLVQFLLGELPSREIARMAAHLQACKRCFKELDSINYAISLLKQLPQEELSPAFEEKLALRLAARRETAAQKIAAPAGRSYPQLRWAAGSLALVFGLFFIALAILHSPPPRQLAKVVHISGHPQARENGTIDWHACKQAEAIQAGVELATSDTDQAEVELADGSRVRMDFNTLVELVQTEGKDAVVRPVQVNLKAGKVWLLLTKAQSGMIVKTPTAEAKSLGTIFTVSVAREGTSLANNAGVPLPEPKTDITVLRGKVDFSNRHGAVTVYAGLYTEALADQPPETPKQMPGWEVARLQLPWGQTYFQIWTPDELNATEAARRLAGNNYPSIDKHPQSAAFRYAALALNAPNPAVRAVGWNNLGVMYELNRQVEESLRAYEEAGRLAPKGALYHYNTGMAFSKVGNLQRAAEEMEAACALSPTVLNARLMLGRFRNFQGESEAAVKQARLLQATSSPGLQAQGDCLMGEIARIKNQLAESETWFLRAAQKDPSYIDSVLYLAAVYYQQGKFDEALNWAERALKLDPNSARALNRKGLALIHLSHDDKAIEVLLKGIAIHPDYFLLYNNLGRAYYKKKNFAASIAAYQKAVVLAPDSAMGHMGFAMALEKGNLLEEATREYARAIEFDPTYKNAYTQLAALNRRLGQKQMANSLLQKAESYGL